MLVLGSESRTRLRVVTFNSSFLILAPSERSVTALLASHSLVQSLVIFASHDPPTVPSSPTPTVRVLHLASPLAVEDTGAVRLVSTLEWAERVARIWRASGSCSADVIYYDEASKDVPVPATSPPMSPSRNAVNPSSVSVESFGGKPFGSRRRLPNLVKRRTSTSSSKSGFLSGGSLPPVDPSQRPFDAILNYIPHDVAEKHVLKQAILVTSITRPFLAPTLSPYHKLSEAKKIGRRNSTTRRGSIRSLPPTPPYQLGDLPTPASSSMTAFSVLSMSAMPPLPSHMVHIVPPTPRIGLVRSLDRFLSSFAKQAVGTEEVDHAKQYILNTSTARETVTHPDFDQDDCTVLDLILLGGLDSVPGKSWIGSGQDIRFLPTSIRSEPSPPPVPRKPIQSPPRTPPDSSRSADPVPRPRVRSSPQRLPPSSGGSPRRPRRTDNRRVEGLQPDSERDLPTIPHPPPRSDPVRHPHPPGPHQSTSLSTSSGRALRRSKLNMITKPDDPTFPTSGLPTPPDSDEDARHTPHTLASEVPTPEKKKFRWRFWKS